MSEVKIKRRIRSVSVSLHTATSSATTVRLDDMAGGVVSLGTISTSVTRIAVHGSDTEGGAFRPLYGPDGSVSEIVLTDPATAPGKIYSLPDAAFALPFVKLVPNNAAANSVSCSVVLKS
jgi:hypothetical protein